MVCIYLQYYNFIINIEFYVCTILYYNVLLSSVHTYINDEGLLACNINTIIKIISSSICCHVIVKYDMHIETDHKITK